jgi:hypothetical protein
MIADADPGRVPHMFDQGDGLFVDYGAIPMGIDGMDMQILRNHSNFFYLFSQVYTLVARERLTRS